MGGRLSTLQGHICHLWKRYIQSMRQHVHSIRELRDARTMYARDYGTKRDQDAWLHRKTRCVPPCPQHIYFSVMTTRRGAGARVATEKLSVPTRVTRSATRNPTVAGNSLVKPLRADSTKVRKPLTSRNDSPPVHQQRTTKKPPVAKEISDNGDRVPIRAFLRIRPNLGDPEHSSAPYLKFISSTTVQMTDPSGTNRIRLNPQTQVYTFNHVFPSETLQAEFFEKTTLPLVQNLLSGQNGLVFTYGVTNSGKTYTIQGGSEHNSAGLLPRTLDVVFNSIEGSQSDLPVSSILRRVSLHNQNSI